MKIDRQKVLNKYSGHCAYCGKPITLKTMQVDHIVPQARRWKLADVHDYSNLNPACRMCNHYKRASSLETFRTFYVGELHKRLAKLYTVRVAVMYGIIEFYPWDGKFYFEKERP